MARKKATTSKRSARVATRAGPKRHSSKKHPIHRRVLRHPLFVFVFLCAGVLLVAWTLKASAVDIKVTARVAGVAPSQPATIDSPIDGARFSQVPVNISGTCSLDSYVSIYSNNINLGSALCSLSGTYNLGVSLLPNQNELIAHIYNLADEEGPQSSSVNVYYDVPPSPPPSGGGQTPESPAQPSKPPVSQEPFRITSEFNVRGYAVGEKVEWAINLSGGAEPYAVNVDWDDGTNSVYSQDKQGELKIGHVYTSSGSIQDSYTVKISASDNAGSQAYLQFFIIVSQDKNPAFSGITYGGGGTSITDTASTFLSKYKWLVVAWPSYVVLGLMSASFWLGEQQAFVKIKKHTRHRLR